MTEDQAKQFRKRAIISATRHGFAGSAEDIAQEVLCRFVAGRGKHQTIDQAVIDVIRSEHGRTGSPGHERRRAVEQPLAGVEVERGPRTEQVHGFDFERLTGMLPAGERIMTRLTHEWGFTGREIADLFGVTESRISQGLGGVEARLFTRVAAEERRVAAQASAEVGQEEKPRSYLSRKAPPSLAEILQGLPVKESGLERFPNRIMAEIEPRQMVLDYEASFQEWLT